MTRNFLHGNQLCRGRCAWDRIYVCVCVCSLCATVHDHRNLSERAFATNSTVCEHGTIENNCRKTFDSSYKRSSPEFCLLSIERFSFFFFFSPFPFLPSSGINSVNSTKSYLIFAQSVSTKEEKLVSSRFFWWPNFIFERYFFFKYKVKCRQILKKSENVICSNNYFLFLFR